MTLASAHVAPVERLAEGNERGLVERARELDPTWDALFTEHHPAIFRYIRYRLSDADAEEDLAAEVFLEAVRGIRKYQDRGIAFRAWLYRIAHNITADHRRRAMLRGSAEHSLLPHGDEPDFSGDVASRRDLAQALQCLTDDQ